MNSTVIFFLITLVNVVLSTVKSILTVKAKSKGSAALINAIAYGFYSMVVKQMATVSTEIVVTATVICNLIGVYFSMWLLDTFSEDTTWKISVIPVQANVDKIKAQLVQADLGYNEFTVNTKYGESLALDIFATTSEQSKTVKRILEENGKVRYHIIELDKSL